MGSGALEKREEAVDSSSANWVEAVGQALRAQRRKVSWICIWHLKICRHS